GGSYDAFLLKLSPSGTRMWSTYFGGNGDDRAYGVAIDPLNNIVLTGYTGSIDHIANAGAYHTAYGGGLDDAFIAKFSPSGSLIWSTYYGGKDEDRANAVTTDQSGNIFITGATFSPNGIATPGS